MRVILIVARWYRMKVLIVDDHELFRFGLCHLLQSESEGCETLEATHVSEAIDLLSRHGDTIDYIFLDLMLPDCLGCDSIIKIKNGYPEVPIVIVSGHEDRLLVQQALQIGVRGFIPKTASNQEVCESIKRILNGEIVIHDSLLSKYADLEAPIKGVELTLRQNEVLELMGKGYTNYQIGCQLGIAENTVRVHVAAIMSALKASNRTEACFVARRCGLL